MTNRLRILTGDNLATLKSIEAESVQCCVTSPPYFGLRSYLPTDHPFKSLEIGTEKTPAEYVAKLVAVFREVRRVLKKDGTLWLNLGDSYCHDSKCGGANGGKNYTSAGGGCSRERKTIGLKDKDLIGIPWMVAFALRDDGWYLRSDIIWNKPNPMPESVTDRPTRAHEYMFLITKSARYYYDKDAIKETPSPALIQQIQEGYNGAAVKDYIGSSVQDASATKSRIISGHRARIDKQRGHGRRHSGFNDKWDALSPAEQALCGSNKRSVWTVAPANCKEAHFATFPPALIQPCILAGSKPGDTILDPFGGSGTTGQVALEYGRQAILCELNDGYIPLIEKRCDVTPGFAL